MNEIFLDTNVFLRHFLQDIPSQSQQATAIIESIEKGEKRGLVSILVVNEMIWILENYYHLKRKDCISQILKILSIDSIKIIEVKKDIIIKILEKMQEQKFDFTDMYLAQIADSKK